jgi:thioredoxin 1
MSAERSFYKPINTLEEFNLATEQPLFSIVGFSASWCGPCKTFAPTFNHAAKINQGKVDFYKVDIDSPELASVLENLQIASVPMYMLFKESKVLEVVRGANETAFMTMVARAVQGNAQ